MVRKKSNLGRGPGRRRRKLNSPRPYGKRRVTSDKSEGNDERKRGEPMRISIEGR